LPGLIDIHVHLREPGQEYKENIETGSRAAAKGGFTSICCMPNTKPVIDSVPTVEYILNRAKAAGLVNVYPIGAITKGQDDQELTELVELKQAGCIAFSDDGKSVLNSQLMRLALEYAKMADALIIEHCQDFLITSGGVMNEGATSTFLGLKGDPAIAESIIVGRDIEIANYLNTRVHLCHISARRCVELIRFAKSQGIKVTAEACPHHFALTDEAVKDFSTNAKMNPPLRTQDDVEAIKEGLKDGTIDCIVTDHAPHSKEEKELDFDHAPFGIIGLETSFGLSMRELVHSGLLTLPELVHRMSTRPAEIVGLNTKGVIKEGFDADITVVDPDEEWVFTEAEVASRSKNSPFYGQTLKGRVTHTITGGKLVYPFKE
jgi:dihydroorotase